jgi:hypothetical protein
VSLNKERLIEEMELWQYYQEKGEFLFEEVIEFGMLPIIISNQCDKDLDRTLFEYFRFFNIPPGKIPELLHLSFVISGTLQLIDQSCVQDYVKERMIGISYVDLTHHHDTCDIIQFEQSRVTLLEKKSYREDILESSIIHKLLKIKPLQVTETRQEKRLVEHLWEYLLGLRSGYGETMTNHNCDSKLYYSLPGSIVRHKNFGEVRVLFNGMCQSRKTIIINTKFGAVMLQDKRKK